MMNMRVCWLSSPALTLLSLLVFINVWISQGITRHYTFDVKLSNVTHMCKTKSMITINGKFPGPRIVAREGDRIIVKVVNHVTNNVTIHWHGIRQVGSQWADGPAYITQCPIQMNQSYVYKFSIKGQRGTFFWHAHTSWLRATLYGPFIILPTRHESYPFPNPHKEVTIMLGEWWNNDTEAVISQALQTGGGPNVSDAYTFNGLPGPFYNSCTGPRGMNDTYKLKVKPGKTYLLRLINAALNDDLFFSIANHTMTVVEADALYIKPFPTNTLVIAPGQTTNVLLRTKPNPTHPTYLMAVRPYSTSSGTFDNTTAAAILQYEFPSKQNPTRTINVTNNDLPSLPNINDTSFVANFSQKLRSLGNAKFPVNVPQTIDKHFFFTVGLGTNPCPKNQTCQGPNNTTKFSASINNISMSQPSKSVLQSYLFGQNSGVYASDFPKFPLFPFNYTGTPPNNTNVMNGTKVVVVPYNASVELVMQDTSILSAESHPLHLHGYDFYVVGQGFGNFNPKTDPAKYNLVDPVARNTVGVPSGGWVTIRFRADNPGAWLMHCHFDVHQSWGLRMVWIVLDGKLTNQKVPPPPADLPNC